VWTPRPWSKTQPDTGAGDPSGADADKGRRFFERVVASIGELLVELSGARDEELP
jgi:creatinine amidohydrolase